MSARILPLLFVSTLALGAGVAPPAQSGGGTSYTPTATDHAGQAMTAASATLSAASGTIAVQVEPGAMLCADGSTSAACIVYDTVATALKSTSNFQAPRLTLTDATSALIVPSGSKVCLDGASCARSVSYTNSITTFSGGITAPGLNSTANVSLTSYLSFAVTGTLPTCSSGTSRRLYVITGTPEKLCWCTDSGGTFQWVNLLDPSDLTGSATVCPAR